VNSHRVPTPHGLLHVATEGSGDHAVVLLHGLGGDHNQGLGFAPAVGQLEADGRPWRKVAVDMRGHGDTETLGPPETLTHAAFLDDLTAVLGWLVAQARVDVLEYIPRSRRISAGELEGITAPALVCVSPEDPAHEMRCGRIIAQRLAQARPLVILPQKKTTPGAHEEQLRRVVGAFLAEQAAVLARVTR
jgi:hypothetical protein